MTNPPYLSTKQYTMEFCLFLHFFFYILYLIWVVNELDDYESILKNFTLLGFVDKFRGQSEYQKSKTSLDQLAFISEITVYEHLLILCLFFYVVFLYTAPLVPGQIWADQKIAGLTKGHCIVPRTHISVPRAFWLGQEKAGLTRGGLGRSDCISDIFLYSISILCWI